MAKKGIFRRIAERVTTPVKRATDAVKNVVTAPFTKKPKPKPAPKVSLQKPKPKPKSIPKPRPNPRMARELLHQKLHDMYWLQEKWDSAATSRRINRMSDDQVYAALDLTEDDIETAARVKPTTESMWADPVDPNNKNILWYHAGETMLG